MVRRLPWLCLLAWLALALSGCGPDSGSPDKQAPPPGVTDTTILLGSSLALSGHAGYLGTQILRGAESYLRLVNDQGGVNGRTIRIKAVDDLYDPPQCLANTQKFIIDDDVFALFCYVGTPTTIKALPLVEEARIPLIGMFTGANVLRFPVNRYVINIRPSYYRETEAAVTHMVKDLGLTRIAVFYQYDAYGFDGLIGTELALKRFGLEPVARGSYARGTQLVGEGLERIRKSKAQAVVMVGTYGACSRFINLALRENFSPVFYNVSFVGAEELARRLGPTTSAKVIMSQVVPMPVTGPAAGSLVSEYVALTRKYHPGDTPSFVGLEGFINARVLVEGLRRAGRDLTREGFIKAMESIRNFELGPGMTITYGPHDRQGLETVYFTRLDDHRFLPLHDWRAYRARLERTP